MGYLRGGRVGRLKVVGPGEDDTHRATQRERRAGRQRLHQGELASEGAAERLRDDADPLQRQVEGAGELPLRHERALGAGRDHEVSVRLQPRRRDLWLDVRLVDPGCPEGPGDDDLARLENRGCVAGAAMNRVEDIARELLVVPFLLALVHARVNRLEVTPVFAFMGDAGKRSSRQHGVLDVDDGWERLVLDDDGLDRVLRGCLALGDDERDRLSCEDDLGSCKRLGRPIRACAGNREVLGREDGDDPGHGEGIVAVDLPDQCVCLRREDEASVEQPMDMAVSRITRRARHLVGRVDTRTRDADHAFGHRAASMRSRARSSARRATTPAMCRRYSAGAKGSP